MNSPAQLFDPESSTFTYILRAANGEAVLVDPVDTQWERDLQQLELWPAHDYKSRSVSTIGWEKKHNSRLAGRDKQGFVELMRKLNLPQPKLIDVAVPANQNLGLPHAV